MEKRINKKIETYLFDFKNNIRDRITNDHMDTNSLLKYIYDYDRLVLEKDDFVKRKRVKNVVPFYDRCCAKKSSGEQCTRRKKNENEQYCGTHMKGITNGFVDETDTAAGGGDLAKTTKRRAEVWIQEIKGIIYYIDKDGNVYQAEDIVNNVTNPKIIAKYVKEGNVYSIPELCI
jgi:hypothetical protein